MKKVVGGSVVVGKRVSKSVRVRELIERYADEYNLSKNVDDYIFVVARFLTANVPNDNGDAFSVEELERFDERLGCYVYETFLGKPHFIEHEDWDKRQARGLVVGVRLDKSNKDDIFVEGVIAIDKTKDELYARAVEEGIINKFSMGCECKRTRCSVCGHIAYSVDEYCEHIARYKGKEFIKDGRRVKAFEWCEGVEFREISAVGVPADRRALGEEILKVASRKVKGVGEEIVVESGVYWVDNVWLEEVGKAIDTDTVEIRFPTRFIVVGEKGDVWLLLENREEIQFEDERGRRVVFKPGELRIFVEKKSIKSGGVKEKGGEDREEELKEVKEEMDRERRKKVSPLEFGVEKVGAIWNPDEWSEAGWGTGWMLELARAYFDVGLTDPVRALQVQQKLKLTYDSQVRDVSEALKGMGLTWDDVFRYPDVKDLRKWIIREFKPEEVELWHSAGFVDSELAIDWKKKNFTPDEAKVWMEKGWEADSAYLWKVNGFDPEEAKKWDRAGFSAGEAKVWKERGFTASEARKWMNIGVFPDEALEYKKMKISPAEAEKLKKEKVILEEGKKFIEVFGDVNVALSWYKKFDYITDEGEVRLLKEWYNRGFSPEEVRRWVETGGFRLDEFESVLNWKNVGWRYDEVSAWKKRFIDPGKARRWKEEGFDAIKAGEWDAKGFSPEEAKRWIDVGFKNPNDAYEWRGIGLDPEEAKSWVRANFYPEQAKEWMDVGIRDAQVASMARSRRFKPSDVKSEEFQDFIRGLGFFIARKGGDRVRSGVEKVGAIWNPTEWEEAGWKSWYLNVGRGYFDTGLTDPVKARAVEDKLDLGNADKVRNIYEALKEMGLTWDDVFRYPDIRGYELERWIWSRFKPEEVAEWHSAEFSVEGAKRWREEGFSPEEARVWAEKGWKPEEAYLWKRDGFDPEEARGWDKAGFSSVSAKKWKEAGFTPSEAKKWDKAGFSLEEAVEYRKLKVSPAEAERLKHEKVILEEGKKFIEVFEDVNVALSWYREFKYISHKDISLLKEWHNRGFTPVEVRRWVDAGFDYDDFERVLDWKGAGWKPDNVSAWKKRFEDPMVARRWREEGFNAAEAEEWSREGFTPEEAKRWIVAGFERPSYANAWRETGLEPEEAKSWKEAGIRSDEAKRWIEVGIRDIQVVSEAEARGFKPSDVKSEEFQDFIRGLGFFIARKGGDRMKGSVKKKGKKVDISGEGLSVDMITSETERRIYELMRRELGLSSGRVWILNGVKVGKGAGKRSKALYLFDNEEEAKRTAFEMSLEDKDRAYNVYGMEFGEDGRATDWEYIYGYYWCGIENVDYRIGLGSLLIEVLKEDTTTTAEDIYNMYREGGIEALKEEVLSWTPGLEEWQKEEIRRITGVRRKGLRFIGNKSVEEVKELGRFLRGVDEKAKEYWRRYLKDVAPGYAEEAVKDIGRRKLSSYKKVGITEEREKELERKWGWEARKYPWVYEAFEAMGVTPQEVRRWYDEISEETAYLVDDYVIAAWMMAGWRDPREVGRWLEVVPGGEDLEEEKKWAEAALKAKMQGFRPEDSKKPEFIEFFRGLGLSVEASRVGRRLGGITDEAVTDIGGEEKEKKEKVRFEKGIVEGVEEGIDRKEKPEVGFESVTEGGIKDIKVESYLRTERGRRLVEARAREIADELVKVNFLKLVRALKLALKRQAKNLEKSGLVRLKAALWDRLVKLGVSEQDAVRVIEGAFKSVLNDMVEDIKLSVQKISAMNDEALVQLEEDVEGLETAPVEEEEEVEEKGEEEKALEKEEALKRALKGNPFLKSSSKEGDGLDILREVLPRYNLPFSDEDLR